MRAEDSTAWDGSEGAMTEQDEVPENNEALAPKQAQTKEEKLVRERAKFIESIAAGAHNTVQTRVAWVLNRYPAARNSDVTLQVTYWRTFDRELLAGPNAVALENLYHLTRLTDIARARAKIQNEYGLFLATDDIKRRRIAKDVQERARQVEDQPGLKTITVYSDETGKNEDHLIVGAVWFLDGMDVYRFTEALKDLRKERGFNDELHFTRIRDQNLDTYLAVLDLLDKYASTISFRAIMIRRRGHSDIQRALDDMLKHVIIRGVEHVDKTGRAPLPRSISVYKDAEEASRDQLAVANLTTDLKNASTTSFEGKLHVSLVQAVDSKSLVPIQLADLFCGSLGKRYNHPPREGGELNAKDRFAAAFLKRFDVSTDAAEDFGGDMTVIEEV